MYVNGVATRKMSKVVEQLCRHMISASAVSAVTKKLDGDVVAWRRRNLADKRCPYLIVDAHITSGCAGGQHPLVSGALVVGIDENGTWAVDRSHPDFGGRAFVAYDAINDGRNGQDCQGHGTHVAGIAGSATYGVAKQASLHAVRVGHCFDAVLSATIAGVQWLRTNRVLPAVANMSLRFFPSPTLDDNVRALVDAGVTVTIAAGNDGSDACNYSPQRIQKYGSTVVSATNSSDSRPSWANYGACVDIFAPGNQILSTYLNSGTATSNGTSMAAPHVAGVAAQFLQMYPSIAPEGVTWKIGNNAITNRVSNPGPGTFNALLFSDWLTTTRRVRYEAHVNELGWLGADYDRELAGTEGIYHHVEAFWATVVNDASSSGICYAVYIEGQGWQSERCNGQVAGTTGLYTPIQRIRIRLQTPNGKEVCYKVHQSIVGWGSEVCDNVIAGQSGNDIEAIRVYVTDA